MKVGLLAVAMVAVLAVQLVVGKADEKVEKLADVWVDRTVVVLAVELAAQ